MCRFEQGQRASDTSHGVQSPGMTGPTVGVQVDAKTMAEGKHYRVCLELDGSSAIGHLPQDILPGAIKPSESGSKSSPKNGA